MSGFARAGVVATISSVRLAASQTSRNPGAPVAEPPLDAPLVETLRWLGTRPCGGHLHTRLDEGGRFLGRAWYGYSPLRCDCTHCRAETLRRRLRVVDGHGGIDAGLHFVATVPPEANLDLDQLRLAKAAALRCARSAASAVLGVPVAQVSGMIIIHPAGDRPGVARPHFDGWLVGVDLSDPIREACFFWAFRKLWHAALSKIAGRVLRTPQAFSRWYGEPRETGYALADTLRSMAGWNVKQRIAFAGPWKKVKIKRDPMTTSFVAGSVPYETVRGAAWNLITPAERAYYEIIRPLTAEETFVVSLSAGVEGGSWIRLGGREYPLDADLLAAAVAPTVARQVADADSRLVAQIILAREELRTLGEVPPAVARYAALLCEDVVRRSTWTSIRPAGWVWDALAFEVYGERLREAPPRVSGLLAASELTDIRAILREELKRVGRWDALQEKRKRRRESKMTIDDVATVSL